MGIQNRDYVREDYGGRRPGWLIDSPATRMLIVVTGAAFVGQLLFPARGGFSLLEQWGVMDPPDVLRGQVWRLVTYAFLHDRHNLLHVILNMLFLAWYGREVERLSNRTEFTLFYLAAAGFAGLTYAIWGLFRNDFTPMVGASGAVMATLMLFACHYPDRRVRFWGIIELSARQIVVLYVIMDLLPVLAQLQGDFFRTGIAHMCHLGGLLFGYLYYRLGWNLSDWWTRRRRGGWRSYLWRPKRGERLKVFQPEAEPENLDAEVDRILAKIQAQGTESLTRQERSLMERASQVYKNRR